ncbi:hypothetical protein HYU22_04760 [Candidatus Woesearchaeota archaeon]|nr:hypothetical protein [Candidatus Woesearchaeota archaeon]
MEEKKYVVVFDEEMKKKLEEIIIKTNSKELIKKWLDKLEHLGPSAGKLLDNHVWIYELKNKHPPLRLYYHHHQETGKIILFELEMKTSEQKQQKTIRRLWYRLQS